MAKNLSERIADRMRNKKTTVSAQNRGAFLALKGEIIQAIEDRWPVKQIWETLHEEGKVTFSYQAFRNYVNSLILAPKQRAVSKPPAQGPRPEKEPVPEKPRTPASDILPLQPPAVTGFQFDAKPKKEDYI
ncbi:TraK family protein [Pseudomonas sp. AK106]